MQIVRKRILKNSSKNITFGAITTQDNYKELPQNNNFNYKDSEYQRIGLNGVLQLTGTTTSDVEICDSQTQNIENITLITLSNVSNNDGSNNCITPNFISNFAINIGELNTVNDSSLNITDNKINTIVETFNKNLVPPNYTITTDGIYNLRGANKFDLKIGWEKTNGTCTEFNLTMNLFISRLNGSEENIQLINYDSSSVIGCIYDDDINDESVNDSRITAVLNYGYNENLTLNAGDKVFFYIDCKAYFTELDSSTGVEAYSVEYDDNGSNREICLLTSSQQQQVQTLQLVESRIEGREANKIFNSGYNNNNAKLLINADSDATLPQSTKMTVFYIPLPSGENIIDNTLKTFTNLVPTVYQDLQSLRNNNRFTALKSGKYKLNLQQDIKFKNLTGLLYDFYEFNIKLVIDINGLQTVVDEYSFTPTESNNLDI